MIRISSFIKDICLSTSYSFLNAFLISINFFFLNSIKLIIFSKVISGYSGGSTENPTYEEVTYSNTGHFETIEIIYDKNITSYNKILDHFWINIDPFDAVGQFCDKGYSYRSVAFFKNDEQRKLINKSKRKIEQKFKKKVVTYVIKFDKFYNAENYHQDYYRKKFLNYLRYKKACGREKKLNSIWNK